VQFVVIVRIGTPSSEIEELMKISGLIAAVGVVALDSLRDGPGNMNDTSRRPPVPDRLPVDPRSPYPVAAVLEHGIGIRLNHTERRDVEECCIGEGWAKVPAGTAVDRNGHPLLIKLKGKVQAFCR
jgi:hypothetical protein